MAKRTQAGADGSQVQPRLSRVLTHLQPNQLECIYGTDARRGSLVHGMLGQAAPLLILGDEAMGRDELAHSLLVQLVALNDPAHLRLAVLERTPTFAPLIGGLPHETAVEADFPALLPGLIEMDAPVVQSRWRLAARTRPPWVLVVAELRDHVLDANAALSLRSLIENGPDWGIYLLALSQCGIPELNRLFRSRIAFSAREESGYAKLFSVGKHVEQLARDRQPGQFLLTGDGEESLLTLPLLDVAALQVNPGGGIRLVLQEVSQVVCSVLHRLLQAEREEGRAALQVNSVAGHIRACSRCRHGIVPAPPALQGWNEVACDACRQWFPIYYEATHADYPLAEMPDRDLLAVALHLGSCPECGEQWNALIQLSTAEEDGAL